MAKQLVRGAGLNLPFARAPYGRGRYGLKGAARFETAQLQAWREATGREAPGEPVTLAVNGAEFTTERAARAAVKGG